nr:hypothetical protein 3 [signal crayfish associated tombus-like virus 1]
MMSMIHTAGRNNRNSRAVKTRFTQPAPRNNSNQPLVSGRTSTSSRRTNIGKSSMNAVSYLRGTERVVTLTIPTTSKAGDLLYTLEGNPNSAPRARAVASQFDSWSSALELEVETTGNAFSKNFILIRHLPNGDPSRLPPSGQSLLNVAEAYDRRDESVKLQLDSNAKGVCKAPWSLSYNPRKPIEDTDASERNLGLFIIVSNGSPGTEPVDITVRLRYDFRFYGPIFQPLVTNSSQLLSNTTTSTTAPFTGATISGPGEAVFTGNIIRFVNAGSYLLNIQATSVSGTISPVFSGVVATNTWNVNQSPSLSYVATLDASTNSTVTVNLTGTLSSVKVLVAPFNVSSTLTTILSQPSRAPPVAASSPPSTLESMANFASQLNMIQGTVTALSQLFSKASLHRQPREAGAALDIQAGTVTTSEPPDPNRIG